MMASNLKDIQEGVYGPRFRKALPDSARTPDRHRSGDRRPDLPAVRSPPGDTEHADGPGEKQRSVVSPGLLAGAAAGVFYGLERPGTAAAFLILCGFFDIIDGKVAANANRKSLFGAIFDSSLDRYSEFFIDMGLAYHFRQGWGIWLIFFAFLGSTMVSYTRARAEGLGIPCAVGIMQRAERILLLFGGTLVGVIFKVFNPAVLAVMAFIAIVSNITALQRLFHVKRYERSRESKEV